MRKLVDNVTIIKKGIGIPMDNKGVQDEENENETIC